MNMFYVIELVISKGLLFLLRFCGAMFAWSRF